MADFTVNRSDGTVIAVVTDGTVDSTSSSISIVGRDIVDYGEIIAETQVHIMENFANSASPSFPTRGQLWWDTTIDILHIYNGTSFVEVGLQGASGGDFDADSKKIINVAEPTTNQDAATKNYVDNNHGLDNVVEDLTPQLGANLDNNGFSITTDSNVVLSFTSGGESAVNWVDIQHETAGFAPIISVKGSDTDIDLKLDTKGAGDIDVSSNKIVNLDDPTVSSDAATKDYVDTEVAGVGTPIPAFRLDAGPVTAILLGDEIVVLSSGGPGQSVTLPLAVAFPAGATLTLKNGIGTSASIITPAGPDTIDGVGGPDAGLLVGPLAFTRLISDSVSNWYVA